ncbi:TMhelix containing protein [Vibrio phage 1.243.O._10N.261.54.B5]|nr:TMhelix containing protein [Vibrio phage 1.243.O._10N.261.54.B5]AUR98847.1 TMhelix containing protein [Vibrio phage 1.256.O._10N.286.45.F8]
MGPINFGITTTGAVLLLCIIGAIFWAAIETILWLLSFVTISI